MHFTRRFDWSTLIATVLELPPHRDLKVWKSEVPHPLLSGFRKAIGEPFGQKADYRLALSDGRSIHVREYDNFYSIHWDKKDPDVDPFGHLVEDSPHWLLILALLVAGVLAKIWKPSRS